MAPAPRPWPLLVLALPLVAGCLGAAPPAEPLAPQAAAPYEGAGVVFLPASTGQERAVSRIPFPVNASGMDGRAELRLGSRMGIEVPVLLTDVRVEVLGPSGDAQAEARLTASSPDAALDLPGLAAGPHELVLRSYGGSDGEAWGDYVAWALRAR